MLLNEEPVAGIAKHHSIEQLPLKVFAKSDVSGIAFTGYKQRVIGIIQRERKMVQTHKITHQGDKLNDHFTNFLTHFEYEKPNKETFKTNID